MIKIAVVDDDIIFCKKITSYIENFQQEHKIPMQVSVFGNGFDFLEKVAIGFDVVFMDIDMPMLSGLQTAKKLRAQDERTILVFITNHAQYAIHGYEVNALDFLVKPLDEFSFGIKMKRILRYLKIHQDHGITLSTTEFGKVRVNYSDIYYFEGEGHYVKVYTKNETYTIRATMKSLESSLTNEHFARCSTSFLVNLQYVYRVDTNAIYLIQDQEIPLSRTKKEEFLQKLSNFYSGGKING